jgi:hypothetical protein
MALNRIVAEFFMVTLHQARHRPPQSLVRYTPSASSL